MLIRVLIKNSTSEFLAENYFTCGSYHKTHCSELNKIFEKL